MAKAEELVDDFSTQDTEVWSGWGEYVQHVDGQVHLGYRTSPGSVLQTPVDYDLTESQVAVELVSHVAVSNHECYLAFGAAAGARKGRVLARQ